MTTADGQPQATAGTGSDTPDDVLAGPSTWSLDPARSSVSLHSKTMWGLATVRGTFGELAGSAGSPAPAARTRGSWRSGAASLNTQERQAGPSILASADFFNAADHPSIVADLASATRTGDRVAVRAR